MWWFHWLITGISGQNCTIKHLDFTIKPLGVREGKTSPREVDSTDPTMCKTRWIIRNLNGCIFQHDWVFSCIGIASRSQLHDLLENSYRYSSWKPPFVGDSPAAFGDTGGYPLTWGSPLDVWLSTIALFKTMRYTIYRLHGKIRIK